MHPALERVFGPRLHHPAVLELLARFGGPTGLRAAGRRRLLTVATRHAPRIGAQLVTDLLTALDAHTVVVPAPPPPRAYSRGSRPCATRSRLGAR